MSAPDISFLPVLKEWAAERGVASFGALDLERLSRSGFSSMAMERLKPSADALGFDSDSLATRSAPWKLFPWAKTVVVAAIPFSALPRPERFPPPPENPDTPSGKVAGYAVRSDYHRRGRETMENLGVRLAAAAGSRGARFEATVDSAAVAERALALAAGIGRTGNNSLTLVDGVGAGCFFAELFAETAFPSADTADLSGLSASSADAASGKGGAERSACPYGAVSADGGVDAPRCVSYLTTMRRGWLERSERRLIGDWLFGCDRCSAAAPGTSLPEAVEVDLEWLLKSPSSEVKTAIADTPMEHAGVTMLRRNALAVLENRGGRAALELAADFARSTGSEFLKKLAEDILQG